MQAASLCFTAPITVKSSRSSVPRRPLLPLRDAPASRRTVVAAAASSSHLESLSVNYNSKSSVFPAEACETVGGDACAVEMFPEVKPESSPSKAEVRAALEEIDRDYLDYSETKTVFPGEACDDLGGEFCEADYQEGVYEEKATA